MQKTLGLYFHIPFCLSKCRYCDFCSFPGYGSEVMEQYVTRICEDLKCAADSCSSYSVDTVYFGGGTPTLLSAGSFSRILETVYSRYRVEENAEITTECNPATGNGEYYSCLRHLGINRISIGLQSADDRELKLLGRIHTRSDFERTYKEIRKAGFDNVSTDLMFGIPGQTEKSFGDTLRYLTDLSPEHISAYGLILEEGTPFYNARESLILPDEDSERAMYLGAVDYLTNAGYPRYEISNFSRPGKISRHNFRYWDCREYLGFGVAAHSYFGNCRFSNSRNLGAYLEGKDISEERKVLTRSDETDEYVMLRLRLDEGVEESVFLSRFGEEFDPHYGKRLEPFLPRDFVRHENGRWFLTSCGMYVSNYILSSVLDLS